MEAIISKQSDLEATMPKSGLGLFLDDIFVAWSAVISVFYTLVWYYILNWFKE